MPDSRGFQPDLISSGSQGRRGFGARDHDQLANRGILRHVEIDDHLKRLRFSLNQTPSDASIIQYFDFHQRGWGFITGDGASASLTTTITLPDEMHDDDYDILVTSLGYLDGSDPTERSDATASVGGQIGFAARVIDAASFEVGVESFNDNALGTTVSLTNGRRYLFSWIIWGTRRGN